VVPEDSVRLPLGDLRALAREAAGDALPVAPDPVRERSYRPEPSLPVGNASENRPQTNPAMRSAAQPGSWDWKPGDPPEPRGRTSADRAHSDRAQPDRSGPAPVTPPRPAADTRSLADRTARRDAPSPEAPPRPASTPRSDASPPPIATVGAYAPVDEPAYEEPPEPPAEGGIPTWVLVFLAVCAVLFLLAMGVLAAVVWYVYLSDSGAAASLSILRTSNGVV